MSSVKIQGSATGTANFTIAVPDGTSTDRTIELPDAAGSFVLADASGNVGIGTSSPSATLEVNSATSNAARLKVGRSTSHSNYFEIGTDGGESTLRATGASSVNGSMIFERNNGTTTTESMRIDSSGNLLVGKTSTGVSNYGFAARGVDGVEIARDGGVPLFINRGTSDGTIIDIRKGNTNAGRILTAGGDIQIGTGENNLYFNDGASSMEPRNSNGVRRDNAIDMGHSSARFDDVYATNGTIQTSDLTLKTAVSSLTDAEIIAAKAISKLFKTFKWNDKVEAKGDAARTHTGVIAQDVEQAMTDAGLDAGNYAFFISSTWHEDADGNEVEADTEGATERNRKGIRYPELLSFIGAATEQRLASIEARLDALEAV